MAADIKERKRIEGALRESEARLQESQRVARLGHYMYDIPSGGWTSSAALDEVFGIDAAYKRDVDGWLTIVHPEDRAAMMAYLEEHVLRDHLPFDREYRVRRIADGNVRWVHGLGKLELEADGRVVRMFGVIQDVTEEHASRSALESSTKLLEEAERLAHLGSWEWDVKTDVARYSREWQRIYGVDRAEMPNQESLKLIHPSGCAARAGRGARGPRRHPLRAEYRIVRQSDGAVRNVEVFGQPVRERRRQVTTVYGASLDVTERAADQEALLERELRVRRLLSGAVSALVATVEMRDPYTSGHQHRVAELAVAIGQLLEWSPERFSDLHFAGLLHDIGKVVVPSEILSKPSRLSPVEFALITAHASAGGDILAPIEFTGPVQQAIVQHHERLDGSGYPHCLKGDAIIPEARVLAVADVFEAMVSDRPYRPGLPLEAAADELRAGAGIRYDAKAVDVCLQLVEDGFAFSAVRQ